MPAKTAMLDSACAWIAQQQAQMLERTIALAQINSGSFHVDGVNAVGDLMRQYFAPLDVAVECLPMAAMQTISDSGEPVERPLGHALRLRKHPAAARQIFLGGHLDTVFAREHPFQAVTLANDGRLHGPGVADLKGGLVVMLTALAALERSPLAGAIGWEVLLNPDEEVGSPSSAALIAEAATRCSVGLIYEPCLPSGHFAGARKGSGNFSLVARGRSAHAGREHHLGRNAIRALCDAISSIDALNGQRDGVTFNPAFIHGGGAVNVVPDRAMARFNIRIAEPADMAWCDQAIAQILAPINARDGIAITLHGGFTRPPKVLDAKHEALFALARDCGARLGLSLEWHPTGGCCDGNNLAAAGIPNIDTLGVRGDHIHSSDEYMLVDSLTERAQLSAMLLLRLAAGELEFTT